MEDDERIRTSVRLALEDEGYDVVEAESGEDALLAFGQAPADVVLIDIMLPGMDGFEVCRAIRKISDVPIVMVTARSDTHDVVAGLEAGADDYLTKPFSFVVLAARLRALLRRSGPRQAVVQIVGDLEIDFDRRAVRRNDREIELTSRELSLLEVMARQPGAVCSKAFLLDQVWGPDFDGGTNVVEVYIGYLRKKIDADASTKLIQTARGHGYRLTS